MPFLFIRCFPPSLQALNFHSSTILWKKLHLSLNLWLFVIFPGIFIFQERTSSEIDSLKAEIDKLTEKAKRKQELYAFKEVFIVLLCHSILPSVGHFDFEISHLRFSKINQDTI